MAQPTWNTSAGSIGSYPYGLPMTFVLSASPVAPATSIIYTLISGNLPTNITLNSNNGILTGIPTLVTQNTVIAFTIRATDNLGNLRDRTFSITVTGSAIPQFTTESGLILSTQDSTWVQQQITYSNPSADNVVTVELQSGSLPPGIEISPTGMIQGYASPPTTSVNLPLITTVGLTTTASNDYIYCISVLGITVGRPVTFTNPIGNIVAGVTYYIREIDITNNAFAISITQNGSILQLTDDSGAMTVTLPSVSVGQPTSRTYNFVLRLVSALGGNFSSYSITVINQNLSSSQGGPGKALNTRIPTILNTRPLTITVNDTDPYYGYYILPPVSPSVSAQMGNYLSDNYFAFKVIGHDFDGGLLTYVYSNLPNWLTGDTTTGWITGDPYLASPGINSYRFTVSVRKINNGSISSVNFNFAFTLSLDITGVITWITPVNLGTIYNGTLSTLKVVADSDVPLLYRITSGSLPPNLTLLTNGEITGVVANQPSDVFLNTGDTTNFSVTIQAYSPTYPVVTSSKTFEVTVYQNYSQPTDILYIQAAPSINDRNILSTLLDDPNLIPTDSLYRPDDSNFGKATSIIYEHAYGIYASGLEEYIAAVTRNHYWRNITLGELKTAVAKDANGNIIYEVVYSEVIDNLINPQGQSVPSSIYWQVPIDLGLGPWYTSITDIFTSYDKDLAPGYYTSRTPGYVRTLYPNSLYNMRTRVSNVLGQVFDSTLLPLWMTSQQENGSTLGYTQAWVICYTLPGYAKSVKTNIETNWPYTLNQINFNIDRFTVNKSITYNWENTLSPPAWSGLPSATPVPDPINSKDFYVLFPRQTILPDETQY